MPVDLMMLLPPYLKGIQEYGILMEVEGTELDAFGKSLGQVRKNLYIQTCDDVTLRGYEQLLGIIREPGTGLEHRRRAVLARMNQQLPYSLPKLKEMLDAAVGRGCYRMDVRYGKYELELDIIDQPYQTLKNIQYMTEEIIPAHLLFTFAGLYPGEIPVSATSSSILELTSDFYVRYNREFLFLDATWLMDGKYLLNGYKEIEALELYPVRLTVMGAHGINPSCGTPEVGTITQARAMPDTQTDMWSQGEVKERCKNGNQLTFKNRVDVGPGMDSFLRVENDLWYLDGTHLLDGTKLLDAEIYVYDL